MAPLVGLAFHSDQSIAMYEFASEYGTNPLRIAKANLNEISEFISKGNFRPVGRFIHYLEEAAWMDLAVALGSPPHIVQGAVRVLMIGILAWAAISVLRALERSATDPAGSSPQNRRRSPIDPLSRLFPLAFASVLIVTGPLHPISFFPFYFISQAIVILVVPLYVASDSAIRTRGLVQPRLLLPALAGSLAIMIHELNYVLPVTCLAMVVLRSWLSGHPLREIRSTVAFHRWVALCLGFLIVFIPSRIAIGVACSANDCYGNTEPALSGLSVGQWLGRSLSGVPVEGWFAASPGAIDAESLERAWSGVSGNVWMTLAAVALVITAIRTGLGLPENQGPRLDLRPGAYRRLGTGLVIFGAILALLPALLVSLSEGLQGWNDRGWGLHDWRDTLLVQVGWAFILYGILVLTRSRAVHRPEGSKLGRRLMRLLPAGLALCLSLSVVLALGANARYAESRRARPQTDVTNLISAAIIDFDHTAAGETLRCSLLAEHTRLACESCWHSGPRLAEQLNNLSLSRHGAAFCATPR